MSLGDRGTRRHATRRGWHVARIALTPCVLVHFLLYRSIKVYIRNTEVLAGTYVHNYEHTFSGYRYKPHLFVQTLDISFSLRLLSPNACRLCLLLAATERTIQSRNPLSRRTRSLLPTLLNMAIRPALARKKLQSRERFKTYSVRNTSDLTGQALWRYTGADTLRARPV